MPGTQPFSSSRPPFGVVPVLFLIVAMLFGHCPSALAFHVPPASSGINAPIGNDGDHHHDHCQTLPTTAATALVSPAATDPEPFTPALASFAVKFIHFHLLQSDPVSGVLAFDPSDIEPRSRFLARLQRLHI